MNSKVESGSTFRNAMLFSLAICLSNVCSSGEVIRTDTHTEKESADRKVRPLKSADSSADKGDEGSKVRSTGDAPDTRQSSSIDGDKTAHSPSYLLMPSNKLAREPSIRNGCWARIYGDQNFAGGALTLTGPLAMPTMLGPLGINWKNRVRSLEVGKTAILTVFDNVNFKNKIATIGPDIQVADLSKKVGYFDDFSSMKISCKV